MIDIVREIEAVQRSVGVAPLGSVEGRSIRLRRQFDAPIDEVWSALTDPSRIGRWFLPISGDYRLGGAYQFEGNAGGRILVCEQPSRLRVTWVYGDPGDAPPSEVEVRLSPAGPDATVLELEHVAVVPDEMWDQFGPGAVGVGWDGVVLGLALHLRGESVGDSTAWQLSPEGIAFFTASSESWGNASSAAGAASDVVARNVAATTAFYTIDPSAAAAPEG